MKIEQRALTDQRAGLKIEKRADGSVHLTGYSAVFYNGTPETQFSLWSGCVERIMPGAFTAAIGRDDVRCLFNHRDSDVFGRTAASTLVIREDAVGLWYDCTLSDGSLSAKDLADKINRRDVTGSSFGFECVDDQWKWDQTSDGVKIEVREVRSVTLWDVGPATFPAYLGTSSEIATRSRDAWREVERLQERRTRIKSLHRTNLLDSARRVLNLK